MWYAVICVVVILLDQISKTVVAVLAGGVDGTNVATLIKNVLSIDYCKNTNGMMGLFKFDIPYLNLIFILVSDAIIGGLLLYVVNMKSKSKWLRWSLAFVIGGAVGNFIDRMVNLHSDSFVHDFIHFTVKVGDKEIFPYIFNLADAFLVVGAIMLILFLLFISEDALFRFHKKKDKDLDDAEKAMEAREGAVKEAEANADKEVEMIETVETTETTETTETVESAGTAEATPNA